MARTGTRYLVPPDQTIVRVLQKHGHDVAVSCEEGLCGTCLTKVLEGEVDHRDVVLTEAERRTDDRMAICVSRARSSRITLDL